LTGGKIPFIETTTVSSGAAHPPGTATNNVGASVGWDLNTLNTTSSQDKVNHYYLNLPALADGQYTVTATLTWFRQNGQSAVNDLNLFLYETATGNLVASSVSGVDNVEHIYWPQLAAGRYDLQVQKRGTSQVSSSETYALAFELFALPLSVQWTTGSAVLTWPLSPTGFQLQTAAGLSAPVIWTNVAASPSVSNNQNYLVWPMTDARHFFRLKRD
jgi:hypothetical protein